MEMIDKGFWFKLRITLVFIFGHNMVCAYLIPWLPKFLQRRKQCPENIFFCDLDDTLLKGNLHAGNFAPFWKYSYEKQNKAVLVYNTGRPLEFVQQKISEGELLPVEFVIAGQGKNVYYKGELWQPWVTRMRSFNFTIEMVDVIESQLRKVDIAPSTVHWDRQDFSLRWFVAGGESLKECVKAYYKVYESVFVTPACWLWTYTEEEIEQQFSECDDWKEWGIGCELFCVQDHGSKAPAAEFLLNWFQQQSCGSCTPRAIWAGDGMNDEEMLYTGWRGIVVGNADEKLKNAARKANVGGTKAYLCTQPRGEGVIEGLKWWSEDWNNV